MPRAHREYAEWTPERLISWAAGTGKATAQVVESILDNNLDKKSLPTQQLLIPVVHENIRGTDYYNDERKPHADTTDYREVELHEANRNG